MNFYKNPNGNHSEEGHERQFNRRLHKRKSLKVFEKGYLHLSHNNKVKAILFLLLLVPPFFILFTQFTEYSQRESDIKVIQLDTQKDTEDVKAEVSQGKWMILGWNYYEHLNSVMENYKVVEEDIMHRRIGEIDESTGFWVLGNLKNQSKEDLEDLPLSQGFIRLQNFQHEPPVEVSVGVSLFIQGNAKVEIPFYHGKSLADIKSTTIQTEGRFFHYGFCNEILKVPFKGLVHQIEIRGKAELDSYIVMDKIYVAVAKNGKSKSLMYSMFPNDWCSTMGDMKRKY